MPQAIVAMQPLLLLLLLLCCCKATVADNFGCHRGNTSSQMRDHFRVNPGLLGNWAQHNSISNDECSTACSFVPSSARISYSGTYRSLCMCSPQKPAAGTGCNATCPTTANCAIVQWDSQLNVSSAEPIFVETHLNISDDNSIGKEQFASVAATGGYPSSRMEIVDHDPHHVTDRASVFGSASLPASFGEQLLRPVFDDGKAVIHVRLTSDESQEDVTKVFTVEQPTSGADLELVYSGKNQSMIYGQQLQALVRLNLGRGRNVSVDFGNGVTQHFQNVLDSMPLTFRKSSWQNATNATLKAAAVDSANPLRLISDFEFSQNTSITQVAFHTFASSGNFQLEVYKPVCTAPTMYCLRTATCTSAAACSNSSSSSSSCINSADKWSLALRACTSPSGVISSAILKRFNGEYERVHSVQISVSRSGFNFVSLAQPLLVAAGDIVGISDTTGLVSELPFITGINDVKSPAPVTNADSKITLHAGNVTAATEDIALQLFGYRQVQLLAVAAFDDNTCLNGSQLTCDDEYPLNVSLRAADETVSRSVIVQVPILGFAVQPSVILCPTHSTVEFSVNNHQGSKPKYKCNFTDGTQEIETLSRSISHAFPQPGNYSATCSATNLVSAENYFIATVHVQNPVNDTIVSASCDTIGATLPTSEASISCTFTLTAAVTFLPTDVSINWIRGDDTELQEAVTWIGTPPKVTVSHNYSVGQYNATATLANLVSSMQFSSELVVVEKLLGAQLITDNDTVLTGMELTFNLTLDWGSDYTAVFDFGDGNTLTETGSDSQHLLQVTYTYQQAGQYVPKVNVTNAASTAAAQLNFTLTVLKKTALFALSAPSVHLIDRVITNTTQWQPLLCINSEYLASPTVYIGDVTLDKGDGSAEADLGRVTSCSSGSADQQAACSSIEGNFTFCHLLQQQQYTGAGNYTATIVVDKFVESRILKHQVTIFAKVSGLSIAAQLPADLAVRPKLAAAASSRTFPVNEQLNFTASIWFGDEIGIVYFWDFGDGTTAITDTPSSSHTFTSVGSHNVKVNASNMYHSAEVTMSLTTFRRVARLRIETDVTYPMMMAYELFLDLGTLAANACFLVDFSQFGETVRHNQTLHMFGVRSACQNLDEFKHQYSTAYWDEQLTQQYTERYTKSLTAPVSSKVTFYKNFTYYDKQNVQFKGGNQHSLYETSLYMVVSKGLCSSPKTNLSRGMPTRFSRDAQIDLDSKLQLSCYNNSVFLKWTVERWDQATGSWQDLKQQLRQFYQNYPAHVQNAVLDDSVFEGHMYKGANTHLKTLSIAAFALQINNRYRVALQANMSDEPSLNSTNIFVFEVFKDNIRPCMEYKVIDTERGRDFPLKSPGQSKFGFDIVFDASCSQNPNKFALAGERPTWSFEYFCNRDCEGEIVFGHDAAYSFGNQPKKVCNRTSLTGEVTHNLTCFADAALKTKHFLQRASLDDWKLTGKMSYVFSKPSYEPWLKDVRDDKVRYLYYMPSTQPDSPLVLSTNASFENGTHLIYAAVRDTSDNSLPAATVIVKVRLTRGMPPIISDICINNCIKTRIKLKKTDGSDCQVKAISLNPSMPLKLQTSIENYFPGAKYEFDWYISRYEAPFKACPSEVSDTMLLNAMNYIRLDPAYKEWHLRNGKLCASTGITSRGLAIDGGPQCFPTDRSGYYGLLVKSQRKGDERNYGYKFMMFTIAAAPDLSQLRVITLPDEGEQGTTRFEIQCSGVTDPEEALFYTIGYSLMADPANIDDCNVVVFNSTECEMLPTTLPGGNPERNNELTICIEVIKASLTSSFNASTRIRVKPVPLQIDELGEGSQVMNAAEGAGSSGNMAQMSGVVLPLLLGLNKANSSEVSQQDKVKVKGQLAKIIADAINSSSGLNASESSQISNINFQTQMLGLLTEGDAEEMDNTTAAAITEAGRTMCNQMNRLSQSDSVSYSTVHAAGKRILRTFDAVMAATTAAADVGDAAAADDAADASADAIGGESNSSTDVLDSLQILASCISNKMVTQEKRTQFTAGNLSVTVEKKEPASISAVRLKAGGDSECDSFMLGGTVDDNGDPLFTEPDPFNPNVTIPSPTVVTKAVKSKKNVFSKANGAKNMTSSTFSITMSTESQGDFKVQNLSKSSWLEMRLSNEDGSSSESVDSAVATTATAKDKIRSHKVTVRKGNAAFIKVNRFVNLTDAVDAVAAAAAAAAQPISFEILIKDNAKPTVTDFDRLCRLPLPPNLSCKPQSTAAGGTTAASSTTEATTTATTEAASTGTATPAAATTTAGAVRARCNCIRSNGSDWLCSRIDNQQLVYDNATTHAATTTTTTTTTTTATAAATATTDPNEAEQQIADCDCNANGCSIAASAAGAEQCSSAKAETPDLWTCFLPPDLIGSRKKTKNLFFVVRAFNRSSWPEDLSDTEPVTDEQIVTEYKSITFTAACYYFDEKKLGFSDEGVHIGQCSTPSETQCFSEHMTSFMASFYVPPIQIDLSDSAWLKLDSNPIALSLVLSLVCFYIIVLIWVRKRDRDDLKKVGVTPLPDNFPGDEFRYELTFWTGARRHAGTSAQVCLMLVGEDAETSPRPIIDPKRPALQTGSVDSFLLRTPVDLGKLSHIRLWHDNSGQNAKWYLSRLLIEDLQTGNKYFFICNRWFAFDEDDGMVDRILPVSGMEEIRKFDVVFWSKAQKNLNDGHIWLSVVTRPPRSRFTRVQRATACLVLLMSTMMVNLMFYGQTEHVQSPQLIEFGSVKFTAHSIYLATISTLIIMPINVLIVILFKNRKSKPKCKAKVQDTTDSSSSKYNASSGGIAHLQQLEEQNGSEVSLQQLQDSSSSSSAQKSSLSQRLRPVIKRIWPLPWWSHIFGYILSLLSVGACTFLMVEFGGVLGEEKTAEWLASISLSLVQSIILVQPIKIVVVAIVYAVFIKKIDEDSDEVAKEMVESGMDPMHETMTMKDLTDPSKRDRFLKQRRAPPPPDQHELRELRKQREREREMTDILWDIAFYIMFLVMLMMAAYTSQDYRSYLQNAHVKRMMLQGVHVLNESHEAMTINEAKRRDSVWDFVNNSLVPAAYPTACYNGEHCDQVGYNWTADPSLLLVRMVQLRQLRIRKPGSCRIATAFTSIIQHCREEYSMMADEEGEFDPGWQSRNQSSASSAQPMWQYTSATSLYGIPQSGYIATYAGGGYVAQLGRTRSSAQAMIEQLKRQNWTDVYTRALFVEMLLYNANTNLYSFCEVLLEFHNGGAFVPDPQVHTLKLGRYIGASGVFFLAIDIVVLLFIVVFMVKEIRALHRQKCSYFKDAFNVMDFILLIVCIAEIGMFITRLVVEKAVSYLMQKYPDRFINFQWLVTWNGMNQLFMGMIVFIFTIRFLRLLTFNKKMRMLGSVLSTAAKPLSHFVVVFFIMFFAFTQMGYLMFYKTVDNFKTPTATIETLGVMTLNKFDFSKFVVGGGTIGMVFFFFYMVFVSFVLINFFLTIIIEAFSQVKADWKTMQNDYEIVDFVMASVKSLFGINPSKKLHHIDTRFNYMQEVSDPQQKLQDLSDKVGELELYICTAGVQLHEKQQQQKQLTKKVLLTE